ncbi:flagellar hook-length control protein FliK [Pseudoduganella sp. GCM10020061]|uniref:flagellar hook-length control protein FliK n=1 Tax=Pseudoduganella sp. GCM10020061 TaxID=3317345 RepID=UPI0036272D6C
MLPRSDILRLNPVGAIKPALAVEPAADPRQQEFERALGGQLGKTLRGDVLSRLADGSFVVKVADTPARMMLPPSTQPGTTVSLHLVAISPRPTFQFNTQTASGAPTVAYAEADAGYDLPDPAPPARTAPQSAATVHIAAATMAQARAGDAAGAQQGALSAQAASGKPSSLAALLLSKAPLVAAAHLPPLDPNTTPAQLSEGARVITEVLATAARNPAPQTAVVARTPLLDPNAAPDARHIAQSLKDAVGRSGLFYESHLREWTAGERPLSEIAREPQMERIAEGAPPRNPATDPASAGFVNLQLATQEQGRIVWMGQLLPGQPVEWEIVREDGGKDGRTGDEGEPAWRSGMKFRFEGLGEIGATVVLSGENVQVKLDAGAPETAGLLRRRAHELGDSLGAAGARLVSFSVRDGNGDV